MPPNSKSRHLWCLALTDEDGKRFLTTPEPFGYVPYQDNRVHVVTSGDTLWSLASKYFSGMPSASLLYWVIADFQPTPILDPTLQLSIGTTVFVPSINTVTNVIFSSARRRET